MLTACEERQEPEAISGTPEFYIIGEFNGEAFEYYAGEGAINEAFSFQDTMGTDWYASRFFLSSNFQDTDELSFDFEFAVSNPLNTSTEIITQPGDIPIQSDSVITYYEVSFVSEIQNPNFTYSWDFGDGNTSSEINPIHRYELGKTDYRVCLSIENDLNCVAEICQTIKPYLSGSLEINVNQGANGLWIFEPVLNGFEAINYEWTLADGNTTNTKQIALQTGSNSIIELCLKAQSRKTEIYEKCIQINTGIDPNTCVANFYFGSKIITDTISSGGVERVIASKLILNNDTYIVTEFDGNYFEIINSEPYLMNSAGEATRKIEFRLELRLVDSNGRLNHLRISEGAMAVGTGDN